MIATGTAILGAAALSAGAGIYGASQAANAQQNASAANNELAAQIWQQSQANLNPFMQAGTAATPIIQGALGYGDPAQAQKAYDAFKASTGYTTNLQAGTNALASNASTRGLLNSGSTIKGAVNYGQKLNTNYFNNWLGQVTGQQGVGLNAASALATGGQSYLNNVTGNNNAAAGATGNAWLTGANAIGSAGNVLAYGAGNGWFGGGGSSYGGGGYGSPGPYPTFPGG